MEYAPPQGQVPPAVPRYSPPPQAAPVAPPAPQPAPQPNPQPYSPLQPSPKPKPSKALVIIAILVIAVILVAVMGWLKYEDHVERGNEANEQFYATQEFVVGNCTFSTIGFTCLGARTTLTNFSMEFQIDPKIQASDLALLEVRSWQHILNCTFAYDTSVEKYVIQCAEPNIYSLAEPTELAVTLRYSFVTDAGLARTREAHALVKNN